MYHFPLENDKLILFKKKIIINKKKIEYYYFLHSLYEYPIRIVPITIPIALII